MYQDPVVAAALGDIGHFFPDTAEEFENIDSRKLLRKVKALIDEKKPEPDQYGHNHTCRGSKDVPPHLGDA